MDNPLLQILVAGFSISAVIGFAAVMWFFAAIEFLATLAMTKPYS